MGIRVHDLLGSGAAVVLPTESGEPVSVPLADFIVIPGKPLALPAPEDDPCNCGIGDQEDIGHWHESWCGARNAPESPLEAAGDRLRAIMTEMG